MDTRYDRAALVQKHAVSVAGIAPGQQMPTEWSARFCSSPSNWHTRFLRDLYGEDNITPRADFEQAYSLCARRRLTQKERVVLDCLYRKDFTSQKTGDICGTTTAQIKRIKSESMSKFRNDSYCRDIFVLGVGYVKEKEKKKAEIKQAIQELEIMDAKIALIKRKGMVYQQMMPVTGSTAETKETHPIDALGLTQRTYNCLKRARIDNVEDLMDRSVDSILDVRGLGNVGFSELVQCMHNAGYMDWPARE